MRADPGEPQKQTAAALLTDILVDLQQLVEQQFQLTRRELEDEFSKRLAAGSVLAYGVGVLFLVAVEICLALVHLLHWGASPPGTDPAWLPLWACHAAVATLLLVLGGILVLVGRARLLSMESCQNPATEIL
jgi:hypothetical protein